MPQKKRLKRMMSYLTDHREVTVEEACALFEVSPATVRRDFNWLAREQKVTKTWGGVRLPPPGETREGATPPDQRDIPFLTEKKRIAERAASLIRENDVVIIDGGTTTSEMTPLIADMRIKIVTNSVLIAHQIHYEGTGKAEVIMTGGLLYPSGALTVGPQAINNLQEYYANIAFLSVGGISDIGATNSNILVVETERQMISQSEQVVMLADRSKFGKPDLVRLCDFDQIHTIITDDQLDKPDLVGLIEREGPRVILA